PRMYDSGERGAVRRPPIVVRNISLNSLVFEWIPKALEQRGEIFGRKKIKQHQDISLFRYLVAVGAVILRLQDEIEPLNIAVAGTIVLPVQLGQLVVAFKLAYETIAIEWQIHPAADVVPTRDLFGRQAEQ